MQNSAPAGSSAGGDARRRTSWPLIGSLGQVDESGLASGSYTTTRSLSASVPARTRTQSPTRQELLSSVLASIDINGALGLRSILRPYSPPLFWLPPWPL